MANNFDQCLPKEFDTVSYNIPKLVDKYQLNKNIYSFMVVVKDKNSDLAMLSHISNILVGNRTFGIGTNKLFENRKSISELKLRVDNFNKEFMRLNN